MYRVCFLLALFLISLQSKVISQNISTVAGDGTFSYGGDNGPAISAAFNSPKDVVIDKSGNIYIADILNHRIRKINTSGIITTIAGNGTQGYSGDNGPATSAKLYRPHGVSVDTSGNVYIADGFNNVIRKVNALGIISTIAGNGSPGFSGDNGLATLAELAYPTDVIPDNNGNIFIVDWFNNVIRKVDTSGIITRVAGNPTVMQLGDGGLATLANLNNPQNIAMDVAGNLYIADGGNQRIRKVNTSGIISTVAGTGIMGYNGDGGKADTSQLSNPYGISVDGFGNVYIADGGNNRIRKVDAFGVITTLAGVGSCGFSGDTGPAILAKLCGPTALAFDLNGNLYISDDSNSRLRKITSVVGISENIEFFEDIQVYPNPNTGIINIVKESEKAAKVHIVDITGKMVYEGVIQGAQRNTMDIGTLQNGIYLLSVDNKRFRIFVNK